MFKKIGKFFKQVKSIFRLIRDTDKLEDNIEYNQLRMFYNDVKNLQRVRIVEINGERQIVIEKRYNNEMPYFLIVLIYSKNVTGFDADLFKNMTDNIECRYNEVGDFNMFTFGVDYSEFDGVVDRIIGNYYQAMKQDITALRFSVFIDRVKN